MYKGYNLRIDVNHDCKSIDDLLNKFNIKYDAFKAKQPMDTDIENSIKKYVMNPVDDGRLDGDAINDDWFPSVESSIFLSHSHDDETLALKIKILLENKFKQKVFVDSFVWKYCNDLLKLLDDKYCLNGNVYDYRKRNNTTAAVHMLLSSALTTMMDKSECVIFLNTNKSNIKTVFDNEVQTASPWIYHELQMMNILRRKSIGERATRLYEANESFGMERKIKVNLPLVKFADFNRWLMQAVDKTTCSEVLDVLYTIIK